MKKSIGNKISKLLELEDKLIKAKAELEKNAMMGYGNGTFKSDFAIKADKLDDGKEVKIVSSPSGDWYKPKPTGKKLLKDSKSGQEELVKFEDDSMVMVPHSKTHMKVYHGKNVSIMSDEDANNHSIKHGGADKTKHGVGMVSHARDTGMSWHNSSADDGMISDKEQDKAHSLMKKSGQEELVKFTKNGQWSL